MIDSLKETTTTRVEVKVNYYKFILLAKLPQQSNQNDIIMMSSGLARTSLFQLLGIYF